MKTLRQAKIGDTVTVVKLHGEGAVRRRIMDMGVTKGTEVHVRKVAPLGDPVEVTVRGYELSIRKADAAETDEPDPPEGKISYALNIEDALREEMQTSPLTAETPETEPAAVAEDTEAMLEQAEASAAEEASPEGASDTMTEDAATASEAPAQEPIEQASAEPSDTAIPIPAPTQELVAQEAPEESYAGAAMLVLVPHRLDVLPFASMSAPPDGAEGFAVASPTGAVASKSFCPLSTFPV